MVGRGRLLYPRSVRRPLQLAAALPLVIAAVLLTACATGSSEPQGWAAPGVYDSTVYYFPKKDRLSSLTLSADRGNHVAWTFPNKSRQGDKDVDLVSVYAGPVRDGDRLYLGTYDGEVYALNAADGSIAWQEGDVNGSIVEGLVLADGRLVFGTSSGYLYALNASDGSPAPGWEKPKKLHDGIWAPPAFGDGKLYVATMGGRLYAFSLADGSEIWDEPFATEGAIASLALVDDTHLFVPTLAKKVFLIDTATGRPTAPVLRTSDWVWTTPAVKDGMAYFGDFSGTIYALDITLGTIAWTAHVGREVKSGPAITNDVLVLVDRSPAVHFLDLQTGKIRNTVPIAGAGTVRANVRLAAEATPLAAKVVIATTKGKLFVADPKGQVVELTVAEGSP